MMPPDIALHWLDLTDYPRRLFLTGFTGPRVIHVEGGESPSSTERAQRAAAQKTKRPRPGFGIK